MKKRYGILVINVLFSCMAWWISALYGIVTILELTGAVSYGVIIIGTAVLLILLLKRYTPAAKPIRFNKSFMILGDRIIYDYEIIGIYEAGPLEKSFFLLINPGCNFTSSFLSKGLLVKTIQQNYLIDSTHMECINSCKIKGGINIKLQGFIFYSISLLPVFLSVCFKITGTDPLWYILPMALFVFFILFRLIPTFYLGTAVDPKKLPLSCKEAAEFKNITVIKGFVLSNRLPILPFLKPSYLDGLAANLLIRKYIVLNPRLFAMESDDYLRFVLFHELCHIKHHDGAGAVVIPAAAILLDIIISIMPESVSSFMPYYDYCLLGIAGIYFLFSVLNRKNIERRADMYGMNTIGEDGINNIKIKLGFDLYKRH